MKPLRAANTGAGLESTTSRLTFYTQAGGRGSRLTLFRAPIHNASQQPHTECRLARRNRHRSDGLLGKNFVGLPRYLLNSLAWRTLKPVPRTAFVELLGIYNGHNNGGLAMSARTLSAAINVSRATAARALAELTERGFIEQTRCGAFSCKVRLASEWRVTLHHCDRTHGVPSKAFMRWRPENQATVSRGSHNGRSTASSPIGSATTLQGTGRC